MDAHYLLKLTIIMKLLKSTLCSDTALVHNTDSICQMQKIESMRHHDSGLILTNALYELLEDIFLDISVKCRQRIIHQQDIPVSIDSSRQNNSRFLASRQIYTHFANLSQIPSW